MAGVISCALGRARRALDALRDVFVMMMDARPSRRQLRLCAGHTLFSRQVALDKHVTPRALFRADFHYICLMQARASHARDTDISARGIVERKDAHAASRFLSATTHAPCGAMPC